MMNIIPKNSHRRKDAIALTSPASPQGVSRADEGGHRSAIRKTRQRYCTIAMVMAIFSGAMLMVVGYPALGKGLILGALFSVINFFLMAMALPMRLGNGRGKSFLISMVSIYSRYVVLAVPLVWAFKQDAFSFSTAAIGLFMVQFAILGDQLLARWRHPAEAG